MDFSHCLTQGRDLSRRVLSLDAIQDEGVYGLFPQFDRLLPPAALGAFADRLRAIDTRQLVKVVDRLPEVWEVSATVRGVLVDFLSRRASFVADTIVGRVAQLCHDQQDLPFPHHPELPPDRS